MIITVIYVLRPVRQTIKSARSINLILISFLILIHPLIRINQSSSWIEKNVEIYKQVYKLIFIYIHIRLNQKNKTINQFFLFHSSQPVVPHSQPMRSSPPAVHPPHSGYLSGRLARLPATGTRLDLGTLTLGENLRQMLVNQ